MRISVICVGRVKEQYLRDAIAEYSKRLGRYCKLDIIEVADENPPMKANSASDSCPAAIGRVSTNMSGFDPAGMLVSPNSAIGSVNRLISSR